MKTNYVHKSSVGKKSFLPFPLQIILGIVVFLLIFYFFFPRALPTFFTTLVRPFWNAERGFRNGETSIEELRREFDESEKTISENNVLVKENEELKSLLSRAPAPHPLLATVLVRPPVSAYDTLILDVGAREKVQKGNRVYAFGNIPIGEIEEVIGDTSRVKLFSSSGETFNVLMGSTSMQTSAMGKGGGYFEASMPRDAKIKVGDEVLIPSLSNAFVARVEGISSDPSEPFSKILFRQPINIYEMRWVLVATASSTQK
jgi:cell shape-determining protein MreC